MKEPKLFSEIRARYFLSKREFWLLNIGVCLYGFLPAVFAMRDDFSDSAIIALVVFGLPLQFAFLFVEITSNKKRSEWYFNAAFRRLDDLESVVDEHVIPPDEGEPSEATVEKKWPWGNHKSKALDDLEAAGVKFWGKNYDPKDQGSAPYNELVISWLIEERDCTPNMAKSIASILRADGLKSGRRR